MQYLGYVVQETLRLHPAAPASIPRLVPGDGTMVEKYRMPGGTQFDTQAWTFYHDPDVSDGPLTYVPAASRMFPFGLSECPLTSS
jgi:cytochrome P450